MEEENEIIKIFTDWCKKCGICIEMCPKNVFEKGPDGFPKVARIKDCVQCEMCNIHCPDFAISVKKRPNKNSKERVETEQ